MKDDLSNPRNWFQPGEDCLTPKQLTEYHEGLGGQATRADVAGHLQNCARCSTELSLIDQFIADAPEHPEAETVQWIVNQLRARSAEIVPMEASPHAMPAEKSLLNRWFGSASMVRWGLAAAALLVMAIALPVLLDRSQESPLTDVDKSSPILRSGKVVVTSPGEEVRAPLDRLEWEAVAGAARYEAVLLEVDRSEIWRSESRDAFLAVPESVQKEAGKDRTLLLQITAFDSSGRTLARSELVRFRVIPR